MSALFLGLAFLLAADPGPEEVTLVFGGDVALGRVVPGPDGPLLRAIGGEAPLAGVREVFAGANLAIVNLECALTDGAPPEGGIRLVARTGTARALAEAGVDLVSVANNHALDAGPGGLAETARALAQVGVEPVGAAERVAIRTVGRQRIAFLAATDRVNATTPPAELASIAFIPSAALGKALPARVAALREAGAADVIVVLVHWGAELVPAPSRAQRALAHALVEAGATLVVGHGSHIVQEVERYQGGVIFYSLGNLVFDMAQARAGALARVTLTAGRVGDVELIPTLAGPDDRPVIRK